MTDDTITPPQEQVQPEGFEQFDGLIRIEEEDTRHLLFKYNCFEKTIEMKTTVGRAGSKDLWSVNIEELLKVGAANIFAAHPVRVIKAKRIEQETEDVLSDD